MPSHHKPEHKEKTGVIHQQYMDIINSIPDAVYWTDINCNLIGCNTSFVHLLGIKNHRDLKGPPYLLMKKYAHWPDKRIDLFKLDDMNVIFSETPRYNIEEQAITNDKNKTYYFRTNRVLMYDEHRKICGLIVVLTDITELKQAKKHLETEVKQETTYNASALETHRLPNVLMIEDNLIAQNVERALLKSLNCEVDIADTGDMAMQLFDPGKYDLVLMDIGLTDTSGYVVAKQLRNKEKGTDYHVPIIALTGYEADVVKYDCEQYYMEGAITKPLTSEQAEQIIKHYVYHLDVEVKGLKSS
jgi:CheY-like chemotaxis protein